MPHCAEIYLHLYLAPPVGVAVLEPACPPGSRACSFWPSTPLAGRRASNTAKTYRPRSDAGNAGPPVRAQVDKDSLSHLTRTA